MECKSCKCKPYQVLNKVINNDLVYCNECNYCKICRKINISKDFCKYCCHKCKRCNKLMQKYNWPNDDIIYGLCYICFHQCNKCLKFLQENKAIYFHNERFCEPCLQEYDKQKNHKKIQYRAVVKKYKYHGKTNLFIGWEKHKILDKCDSCKKEFWKYIRKKSLCKSCKKKQNKTKAKDPSNKLFKYEFDKDKNKWILTKKAKICIDCFTVEWVNVDCDNSECPNCKKVNRMNKRKYKKSKKVDI